MRNDWKVRHVIRNSGGVSNLQRKPVYLDREGRIPGCTEKSTKANQKMLNKMAKEAESFYYQVDNFNRPILEQREFVLVDRIINNHYSELGDYGDQLDRSQEYRPEKRVDSKFLDWFTQEFPSLHEGKVFDTMYVIGPEILREYLIESIEKCDSHSHSNGWLVNSPNYTRCVVNKAGEKTPPAKKQLIEEITKFTRQEEMKCQIKLVA